MFIALSTSRLGRRGEPPHRHCRICSHAAAVEQRLSQQKLRLDQAVSRG
jgi:predicted nucleic acid-binding Zn ribbon protein